MLRVFKYTIDPNGYVSVMLPMGAQILSVQAQLEKVCLWALVDPEAPVEFRSFRFAGTGHDILEARENLKYIATFQMQGGALVFHLFEIIIS